MEVVSLGARCDIVTEDEYRERLAWVPLAAAAPPTTTPATTPPPAASAPATPARVAPGGEDP